MKGAVAFSAERLKAIKAFKLRKNSPLDVHKVHLRVSSVCSASKIEQPYAIFNATVPLLFL